MERAGLREEPVWYWVRILPTHYSLLLIALGILEGMLRGQESEEGKEEEKKTAHIYEVHLNTLNICPTLVVIADVGGLCCLGVLQRSGLFQPCWR